MWARGTSQQATDHHFIGLWPSYYFERIGLAEFPGDSYT
jgi:hypothetical protein